jgi:hypothetical protein
MPRQALGCNTQKLQFGGKPQLEALAKSNNTISSDAMLSVYDLDGIKAVTQAAPRSGPNWVRSVKKPTLADDSPYLFRKLDEQRCA